MSTLFSNLHTTAKAGISGNKSRRSWQEISAFAGMTALLTVFFATPAHAATSEGTPAWAMLAYLAAGVFFILALRGLSSPASSRAGNRNGMIGMAIALVTTLVTHDIANIVEIGIATGALLYGGVGVVSMLLGGSFLDYGLLDGHDPAHGQHLGILLVELGVGITVAAVMIAIFYAFARRGESS